MKHGLNPKLAERLEDAIEYHLNRWVEWYDKNPEAGYDEIAAKTKAGYRIIDRNLVAAYLSLKAEKKAAEDNRRLQTWLIVFAAISTLAVVIQALR